MRRIVVFNRITLDGFYAGPNGEIDWFIPDPELDKAVHAGASADTLLAGRITYQLFESVWPRMADDPDAPKEMRATARELTAMLKVVFTNTLEHTAWENTRLVRGDVVKEAGRLKQGDGSDILIFGSGTIIRPLTSASLIDDYFLAVTPVVLGMGKQMFQDTQRRRLKLVGSQSFRSGNVLLHYTP